MEELEEFLQRESQKIYRSLLRIGAKHEDAEDVVQETIYRTIVNLDSIRTSSLSAWMARVALHYYYDLGRKRKKMIPTQWDLEQIPSSYWEIPAPFEMRL